MNIAIIDVGSNNIKLEIYDITSRNSPNLLYRIKENARLGHHAFLSKRISTTSKKKAIQGMQNFAKITKQMKCSKIIAIGTAALREATNSKEFIKEIYEKTKITIKIVSGLEEARTGPYRNYMEFELFRENKFFFK